MKKELFNVADVEVLFEGEWYPYGEHNPAADGYTACYVRRETGRPFWVLLENWNGERWEVAQRLPQGQSSSKVGDVIASDVRPVYIEDEDGNTFIVGLVF